MFNSEFMQEAMVMTDAKPRLVSGRLTLRAMLLLPAAALIFIGSMFQLGMLGYGQLDLRNLWPALMIVQTAWNLVAAHLNAPEFADLSRFWPLLLVASGFAVLLALKPKNSADAPRTSHMGDR
jgi:hypothetical protein